MKKAKYYIAETKGFTLVDGYTFDIVYGDNKYTMGVHQNSNSKKWFIDHLESGFALVIGSKTKKEAVESITYELMDKFESVLNNPNTLKRIEMLREYQKEHALQ